ncbi:hypothetical protein E2562_031897 [Oryza meyeriana var. granulata]|uniref:Uncharacterized protein n=1 Tax=Oryza meyeriana var. granulata TaxID=110450 RepID=A0A6G1D9R0_9ORYZ|nr:hypothetical protein E2562_031897 [Oryza meyeriana var. granulata]
MVVSNKQCQSSKAGEVAAAEKTERDEREGNEKRNYRKAVKPEGSERWFAVNVGEMWMETACRQIGRRILTPVTSRFLELSQCRVKMGKGEETETEI